MWYQYGTYGKITHECVIAHPYIHELMWLILKMITKLLTHMYTNEIKFLLHLLHTKNINKSLSSSVIFYKPVQVCTLGSVLLCKFYPRCINKGNL